MSYKEGREEYGFVACFNVKEVEESFDYIT